MAQWVKDLASSLLWHGLYPWPQNFHSLWAWPKTKNTTQQNFKESKSYSNTGSEPCLQPAPQLRATRIVNPLSKGRDRTHNLMLPSWVR